MFEIKNLSKHYISKSGQVAQVLNHINLTIEKGTITAIVGPSGSGKSTLSKCLSLLETPSTGELWLDGVELTGLNADQLRQQRQKIGLIFQSSALLKRRTAAENIALPLEFIGVVDQQIKTRVHELLVNVGLENRADHYPSQLSGGQQQRVGIARALALNPSILIADEATSGLDPDSTQSILKLLTELRDQLGLSVILITHEMDVVRQIADSVAVLSHGEIVEKGRVLDLVLNPKSEIGQKILPLNLPTEESSSHHQLQVVYSSSLGTPLNWLSQLSLLIQHPIDIVQSIVEEINHTTVGKSVLAIPHDIWAFSSQEIIHFLQEHHIQFQSLNTHPQLIPSPTRNTQAA